MKFGLVLFFPLMLYHSGRTMHYLFIFYIILRLRLVLGSHCLPEAVVGLD
jgi:hypothetical protein